MPDPKTLTTSEIASVLAEAPGWTVAADGALTLQRRFPNAAAAVGFIAAVGAVAERSGHHPELLWVYRDVTLRLVTHDAGGAVTDRDAALVSAIVALA